jgi:hypothetical protein
MDEIPLHWLSRIRRKLGVKTYIQYDTVSSRASGQATRIPESRAIPLHQRMESQSCHTGYRTSVTYPLFGWSFDNLLAKARFASPIRF